MSTVAAFHSSKAMDVHHVCSTCTEGNNIESQYRKAGTGGLPLCKNCSERQKNKTC